MSAVCPASLFDRLMAHLDAALWDAVLTPRRARRRPSPTRSNSLPTSKCRPARRAEGRQGCPARPLLSGGMRSALRPTKRNARRRAKGRRRSQAAVAPLFAALYANCGFVAAGLAPAQLLTAFTRKHDLWPVTMASRMLWTPWLVAIDVKGLCSMMPSGCTCRLKSSRTWSPYLRRPWPLPGDRRRGCQSACTPPRS